MLTFSKMTGIGNDYIYVNCFQETVVNPEKLSIFMSDVRFGVGSDGLVSDSYRLKWLIFRMRIFNADGSEAMMCGNATRCVGKYVYDTRHDRQDRRCPLETNSGIKYSDALSRRERPAKSDAVKVDMGKAILVTGMTFLWQIRLVTRFIAQPVDVAGHDL
ncbi:MAG: hypothetical protein ACLUSL_00540 [Ruminococcus sp.]